MDFILNIVSSALGILIPVAIVVVLIFLVVKSGYVTASTNEAVIITGMRKEPKVLIGGSSLMVPMFQKVDRLSLALVAIGVRTSTTVPTADYINVMVDASVNVKISDDPKKLALAAQNFLNRDSNYLASVAREVLEGNVREIIGKMKLEEMVSDRERFTALVRENADPDLEAMGLDIVSFNVQSFTDENGVIENLGVDNVVKIQKNAAISRAESEKEIKKAQAQAAKEANDAEVKSRLEIANAKANADKEQAIVEAEAERESREAQINAQTLIAQKETELEIRKAELKKEADAKNAIADAAYDIQKETERKAVEIATADADLAKQEKAIILQEREVELTEKTLEAEIKKKADAEKYAIQQKADAVLYEKQRDSEAALFERQKNAEAEKFEKEKEAEAMRITAEADKFAAEQKAEGIRAVGLAEAESIKAKALAEAEGIREKAEAMKEMDTAAILEMYFKAMPDIAKNVAAPLAQTDKIVMFGDGNSTKMTKDIMGSVTQIVEGVKESTGVDLTSWLKEMTAGKSKKNN